MRFVAALAVFALCLSQANASEIVRAEAYITDTAATNWSINYGRNYVTLTNVIAEIGTSRNVTLLLSGGTWTYTGAVSQSANIALDIEPGSYLQQSGSGSWTMAGEQVVKPEWWGAGLPGNVDDSDEIEAAINAVSANSYVLFSAIYPTTNTIVVSRNDLSLVGVNNDIGGVNHSTLFVPAFWVRAGCTNITFKSLKIFGPYTEAVAAVEDAANRMQSEYVIESAAISTFNEAGMRDTVVVQDCDIQQWIGGLAFVDGGSKDFLVKGCNFDKIQFASWVNGLTNRLTDTADTNAFQYSVDYIDNRVNVTYGDNNTTDTDFQSRGLYGGTLNRFYAQGNYVRGSFTSLEAFYTGSPTNHFGTDVLAMAVDNDVDAWLSITGFGRQIVQNNSIDTLSRRGDLRGFEAIEVWDNALVDGNYVTSGGPGLLHGVDCIISNNRFVECGIYSVGSVPVVFIANLVDYNKWPTNRILNANVLISGNVFDRCNNPDTSGGIDRGPIVAMNQVARLFQTPPYTGGGTTNFFKTVRGITISDNIVIDSGPLAWGWGIEECLISGNIVIDSKAGTLSDSLVTLYGNSQFRVVNNMFRVTDTSKPQLCTGVIDRKSGRVWANDNTLLNFSDAFQVDTDQAEFSPNEIGENIVDGDVKPLRYSGIPTATQLATINSSWAKGSKAMSSVPYSPGFEVSEPEGWYCRTAGTFGSLTNITVVGGVTNSTTVRINCEYGGTYRRSPADRDGRIIRSGEVVSLGGSGRYTIVTAEPISDSVPLSLGALAGLTNQAAVFELTFDSSATATAGASVQYTAPAFHAINGGQSIQTNLAPSDVINPAMGKVTVSGAGDITLTNAPPITAGYPGQTLTIMGTDNINRVTITNTISTGPWLSADMIIGSADTLSLIYLDGAWRETARSNND